VDDLLYRLSFLLQATVRLFILVFFRNGTGGTRLDFSLGAEVLFSLILSRSCFPPPAALHLISSGKEDQLGFLPFYDVVDLLLLDTIRKYRRDRRIPYSYPPLFFPGDFSPGRIPPCIVSRYHPAGTATPGHFP